MPTYTLAHDPLWYEDVGILFAGDRVWEMWPHVMHSTEEKINAVTRLVLFTTVALYLATRKPKYLLMGAPAILALAYLGMYRKQHVTPVVPGTAVPIVATGSTCPSSLATEDNPFGNRLAGTPNFYEPHSVCPPHIPQKDPHKALFTNFTDAWEKQSSHRQFFTVPEHDPSKFTQYLKQGPSLEKY